MDNDLDRSVRLLEDALSTPTHGLFKKSTSEQRKQRLNLSLSLAPDEIRKLLESDNNPYYNDTIGTIMESNKTVTGSVIQSGLPWTSTVDGLLMEFVEICQCETSNVLEVASDLARCCSDALKVMQELKARVAVKHCPDEKWLENERNTWRLLFILYQDRINSRQLEEDLPYLGDSEKLCVENLFKRDSLIRESQLIIDWLERSALERSDSILTHSDWTYGWEHTIHQLLLPENIAIESNTEIVKNLHPDAPQFENLPLHHLDMANEKQLNQRIFMEIRCGNLEGAQELLYNSGHSWRAALLEGWKLYHNPNIKEFFDEEESEIFQSEFEDIEGNANRDLWKNMALEYCKKKNLNIYEKAAVAAFCGYLEVLLAVCNNWEDNLWAYLRTMVDIRVESEIRDNLTRSYMALPEEYWEQKMSINEIFAALEASKSPLVRMESQEPDHIIQKYVILDEIPKLITHFVEWIEQNTELPIHFLRYLAHLILFFTQLGEVSGPDCEKIIEAYIERLSDINETQLLTFYISKLPRRKQIVLYACHLEKIVDNDARREALQYGEDNGLDMLAITKMVVENIRNRPNQIPISGNLNAKITEEDEFKISALDWLLFYDVQRIDVLIQCNALIFTYLTLGKIDVAQLLMNKIPNDSIDKILQENSDNETNQIIKEHLSYKAYLNAHEQFNEWFRQYQNKPKRPNDLLETAQFTEKVAHQHRISQYEAELERWKLTISHSGKTAKTLLYNVLLFPNGWLIGADNSDYLRSICLPQIVSLLYSVLYEMAFYQEAVQLADLIANEKYALYKVYSKEKLGEILEKICESSLALLNNKKDPFGSTSN